MHELAKRGDTAGAIENYRAALKLDSTLPGLHFELAEMLSTLGTVQASREAEAEYQANPDGQRVLVLTNPGPATKVQLRLMNMAASVSLEPDSVTTLLWR